MFTFDLLAKVKTARGTCSEDGILRDKFSHELDFRLSIYSEISYDVRQIVVNNPSQQFRTVVSTMNTRTKKWRHHFGDIRWGPPTVFSYLKSASQ